jgi:hypothetical protein
VRDGCFEGADGSQFFCPLFRLRDRQDGALDFRLDLRTLVKEAGGLYGRIERSISGAKEHDKGPAFDALCRDATKRR